MYAPSLPVTVPRWRPIDYRSHLATPNVSRTVGIKSRLVYLRVRKAGMMCVGFWILFVCLFLREKKMHRRLSYPSDPAVQQRFPGALCVSPQRRVWLMARARCLRGEAQRLLS